MNRLSIPAITLMREVYSLHVFMSKSPQEANTETLRVNVEMCMCVHVICQAYGRSPARPRPPRCDRWCQWPGSGRYPRPR